MHFTRLSLFLATALVAPLAGAHAQAPTQLVTFTGKLVVAPVPGSAFCEGAEYALDCSGDALGSSAGIPVRSDDLDLSQLVGELYEYTAGWTVGPCTSLDVFDAAPPKATLVQCGNPVPGCPVRFRVGPSGAIGQWSLYFSAGPAFLPIGTDATLLIANPVLLGSGLLFGETQTFDITVPPDVALTGLSLWFQGTRQSIAPVGPLQLTNAECLTILGPSPPCIAPDC